MNEHTIEKLAAYFSEEELQEIAGIEKTASVDYRMGEVAAISYHETLNKLASQNDLVKTAAHYANLGEEAAIRDFYKQAGVAGQIADSAKGLAVGAGEAGLRAGRDVAKAGYGLAKNVAKSGYGMASAAGAKGLAAGEDAARALYDAAKSGGGQGYDMAASAASKGYKGLTAGAENAYNMAGSGLGRGYDMAAAAGNKGYDLAGKALNYAYDAPGRLYDEAGNLYNAGAEILDAGGIDELGNAIDPAFLRPGHRLEDFAGIARDVPGYLASSVNIPRSVGDAAIIGGGLGAAGYGANAAYNAATKKASDRQNKKNMIKMMIMNGQL